MDVRDRNVSVYLPKDFKSGLDGDLHLGRKKWILIRGPRSTTGLYPQLPLRGWRQELKDCPGY